MSLSSTVVETSVLVERFAKLFGRAERTGWLSSSSTRDRAPRPGGYAGRVSGTTAMNLIVASAVIAPFPVLGAICWWFWKHRHDE
jgi:hypothetical protein